MNDDDRKIAETLIEDLVRLAREPAPQQPQGEPLSLEEIATLLASVGPFQKTTNPLACDLPYPTENQVF
jgi:hypothetical protein